jgi:ppGpp synthetase/RelA/SpoT-type nucleotidyltranferase
MKIPASVRAIFEQLLPRYKELRKRVDDLVQSKMERRWHYESRVKSEQSFALKLETGRERNLDQPEDFFACMIVVENQTRVQDAETFVCSHFDLLSRRPESSDSTPLPAHSFDFDDLRLYVAWKDDPAQKPTGLHGLRFEFQIKTYLQHAWSVATHDLVYKTDDVNWATSRIAYQVKAALENAELSIAEARRLTDAAMLKKMDKASGDLLRTIAEIRSRWSSEQLPKDLRRLALNVCDISRLLKVGLDEIWNCVDAATVTGAGTKTLNLSPHGAILSALLQKHGPNIFQPLASAKRGRLFVPIEIELPELPEKVMDRMLRPARRDQSPVVNGLEPHPDTAQETSPH